MNTREENTERWTEKSFQDNCTRAVRTSRRAAALTTIYIYMVDSRRKTPSTFLVGKMRGRVKKKKKKKKNEPDHFHSTPSRGIKP